MADTTGTRFFCIAIIIVCLIITFLNFYVLVSTRSLFRELHLKNLNQASNYSHHEAISQQGSVQKDIADLERRKQLHKEFTDQQRDYLEQIDKLLDRMNLLKDLTGEVQQRAPLQRNQHQDAFLLEKNWDHHHNHVDVQPKNQPEAEDLIPIVSQSLTNPLDEIFGPGFWSESIPNAIDNSLPFHRQRRAIYLRPKRHHIPNLMAFRNRNRRHHETLLLNEHGSPVPIPAEIPLTDDHFRGKPKVKIFE